MATTTARRSKGGHTMSSFRRSGRRKPLRERIDLFLYCLVCFVIVAYCAQVLSSRQLGGKADQKAPSARAAAEGYVMGVLKAKRSVYDECRFTTLDEKRYRLDGNVHWQNQAGVSITKRK